MTPKFFNFPVVVDHTFSPIRLRACDLDHVGYMIERGTLNAMVPPIDGEPGIWGSGQILIPSGRIFLRISQNAWSTVAAGGSDLEWLDGGGSWQAIISGGEINGFRVTERGCMTGTK